MIGLLTIELIPPSTLSTCPVTHPDAGLINQAIAEAMSSGSPIRPRGCMHGTGHFQRAGIVRDRLCHFGSHQARCHSVKPQTATGISRTRRLHQPDDARLGSGNGFVIRDADTRRHG